MNFGNNEALLKIRQILYLESELAYGIRDWQPNTDYFIGNTVYFNNSIFKALIDNNNPSFMHSSWKALTSPSQRYSTINGEISGIDGGRAVYLNANGKVYMPDMQNKSHVDSIIGITLNKSSYNENVEVVINGFDTFSNTIDPFTASSGVPVYIKSSGIISEVINTPLDTYRITIGTGINTSQMIVNMQEKSLPLVNDYVFANNTNGGETKELLLPSYIGYNTITNDTTSYNIYILGTDSAGDIYSEELNFMTHNKIISTIITSNININNIGPVDTLVSIGSINADNYIKVLVTGILGKTIEWKMKLEENTI